VVVSKFAEHVPSYRFENTRRDMVCICHGARSATGSAKLLTCWPRFMSCRRSWCARLQ
jgi:hypothetical protein